MTYPEIYSRLSYETAVVTFLKKNGEARVMLATRNLHTAELKHGFLGGKLGGHDKRCNISNGNIAVIDLILGEGRSFNIDRILGVQFVGEITTVEKLDEVIDEYVKYKNEYESKVKGTDVFNDISISDKAGTVENVSKGIGTNAGIGTGAVEVNTVNEVPAGNLNDIFATGGAKLDIFGGGNYD